MRSNVSSLYDFWNYLWNFYFHQNKKYLIQIPDNLCVGTLWYYYYWIFYSKYLSICPKLASKKIEIYYRQVDQPLIKNVAKKPEKTGKIISTCRIFLTLVISLPLLWTILFLIYKFEYKFESKRRNEVQIRIVDKAIKSNLSSPELDSKRVQLIKKRFSAQSDGFKDAWLKDAWKKVGY